MIDPMEDLLGRPSHEMPDPSSPAEHLIREFVEHWGLMARTWGINSTMGELFALLYITGTDWTADDLRHWLGVSRGNVSMNLRELLAWGVVHKVHRPASAGSFPSGDRRLDPVSQDPERTQATRARSQSVRPRSCVPLADEDPALCELKERIEPLRRFFRLIDSLAVRLLSMPSGDLAEISQIMADDDAS